MLSKSTPEKEILTMKRPDFRTIRTLTRVIEDADKTFNGIYAEKEHQESDVRAICQKISAQMAKELLKDYSVSELKNAKAGIRVSALENAGFKSLGDLAKASDTDIESIEGIGQKQREAIRDILTDFANSLSSKVTIKLSADAKEKSLYNHELITALARLIQSEKVRTEGKDTVAEFRDFTGRILSDHYIKNSIHWLFSGSGLKQHTLEVSEELQAFCSSDFFQNALAIVDRYHVASNTATDVALEIFARNAADFYAMLEKLGSGTGNKPFVYGSIPSRLAGEIDDYETDLSDFKGNLRSYQLFGVKYILHQRYVLLGDEMGLGKTVQAIAAMTHVAADRELHHFLVVCPASVIVNWEREIQKFSSIKTYVLHGQSLMASFERWIDDGGAAVTNYESMGKIVDQIDEHMKLSMLVIDEAHYIKNPDAKRTAYIRRLDNESERILLMTGTPLENRVQEMCSLLEFVRPDMTEEIRSLAHLHNLPEFKEKLSPVYLRRIREQVLSELPPIEERQEWCTMTGADEGAYIETVMQQSFINMRRVSFLQEDMSSSTKMNRLLELCSEAADEGRRVVVYSYFRETVEKVKSTLGSMCAGVITGDTKVELRQGIIDSFSTGVVLQAGESMQYNEAPKLNEAKKSCETMKSEDRNGKVLVCQIQAGGVGLNIQAASIVIFCEPQIKPSLTWQALSRVYRMGQVRNVLVYHLLCPGTVDEKMNHLFKEKKLEFDSFASESAVADAYDNMVGREWIQDFLREEKEKYG